MSHLVTQGKHLQKQVYLSLCHVRWTLSICWIMCARVRCAQYRSARFFPPVTRENIVCWRLSWAASKTFCGEKSTRSSSTSRFVRKMSRSYGMSNKPHSFSHIYTVPLTRSCKPQSFFQMQNTRQSLPKGQVCRLTLLNEAFICEISLVVNLKQW